MSHGPTQFQGTEHGPRASFSAGTPNQGKKAFLKRTKSKSFPPSSYLCQTCMQWRWQASNWFGNCVFGCNWGVYSAGSIFWAHLLVRMFCFACTIHTFVLFDSVVVHPSHLQIISRMECSKRMHPNFLGGYPICGLTFGRGGCFFQVLNR